MFARAKWWSWDLIKSGHMQLCDMTNKWNKTKRREAKNTEMRLCISTAPVIQTNMSKTERWMRDQSREEDRRQWWWKRSGANPLNYSWAQERRGHLGTKQRSLNLDRPSAFEFLRWEGASVARMKVFWKLRRCTSTTVKMSACPISNHLIDGVSLKDGDEGASVKLMAVTHWRFWWKVINGALKYIWLYVRVHV